MRVLKRNTKKSRKIRYINTIVIVNSESVRLKASFQCQVFYPVINQILAHTINTNVMRSQSQVKKKNVHKHIYDAYTHTQMLIKYICVKSYCIEWIISNFRLTINRVKIVASNSCHKASHISASHSPAMGKKTKTKQ